MGIHALRIFVALAVAGSTLQAEENGGADPPSKRAFVFGNVPYFHRWSQNDQHEFTPAKQEDLKRWSDMITVNGYPDVVDGEKLAATASAVLENYKKHQARVLKVRSVPRTAEQPAEHLIAVQFTQPDFIEVAFARFKLLDGKGCSLVYSHRIYGKETGDAMSAWLSVHGDHIETTLMKWSSIPSPTLLRQEPL
jgi:hypothetical protein